MSPTLPLHVIELGPDPNTEASTAPETFLLLHGYAGSSFTWRHWAPTLARRGRVLLVDMKGFGEAPKPDDGRYGPEHLADLVVQLVRDLDLQRLTLIGHSLGGGVALIATLALRDSGERRLHRLVLVASAAYPQRLPPFVAFARRPLLSTLVIRLLGPRVVIRAALRAIVYDRSSVTEQQVTAYARPLESREGIRALLDAGRQIVPDALDELSRRFSEIDLPTLVMWGRHDRVVPLTIGVRLAADLPNARLEILEECGHMPPEELPEASLAILQSFLDAVG